MLTWDTTNNVGIPFEWTNLNTNQQTVLDDENGTADSAATSQYRLNYLRGDRSNEITSSGTGLYRAREGILGDIVDSSPSWVGPPYRRIRQAWGDRLYSTTTMPENTGTQTYVQYVSAEQGRLNVVYAGANDGFLHGFEAGKLRSPWEFLRHDELVDNLLGDSQRWQGSACVHAGIDPVQPGALHHHGRLRRHQYQHRNCGAKHSWLDPGHRWYRHVMRDPRARLFGHALRP